jgi:hypothetical protein
MAGKSMKYHTDNLSSNPPFYYKWFKRPTFSDSEALARAKYEAEKTNHYDTIINTCERDIYLNHQQYQADKIALDSKINLDFDTIIQTNRVKLETAKRLLNQIHQTSSSIDSLKKNGTICGTSSLSF